MITSNYTIFGRRYGSSFLNNLVGYYPLNSNANDFSGKGYNGTIIGSPTYSAGKVSNAINLLNNSSLNHIDIPDNSDYSFSNGTNDVPFSISMWVNFSNFSFTGNWLINKRTATSAGDEWQFIYYENVIQFYKFQFNNNSINQVIKNTVSLSLNTWYHICITDDAVNINGLKLYLNGNLTSVTRTTTGAYTKMNNGTSITRIGNSSWNALDAFKHKGLIDELAIWKSRELTSAEVLDIYNKGNSGTPII